MDLRFNGKAGLLPARDSVEWLVLEACADDSAWSRLLRLRPGDSEWAIERLRDLGWGFEWVTFH